MCPPQTCEPLHLLLHLLVHFLSLSVSGDCALASSEAVSCHHRHRSCFLSLCRLSQGVHTQTLVLCSAHSIEGYRSPCAHSLAVSLSVKQLPKSCAWSLPLLAACSQLGVWAAIWPWPFAPRLAGSGVPVGGEAGAELGLEESSQRPTLGHEVRWSLALAPHPWHLPQFPHATLLLSLAPGLSSCPTPGNLGPVGVFPGSF